MNSIQNCSSNPNTKRKNKKRKNRSQRYKNSKFQNGYDTSQINATKQNGDSVKPTNPLPSSPRPTDFNNFPLENKRCSGSEYEEFHTPNYEYPEISKTEINIERSNSTDDEWDEIAKFSKSNLEGIPEQDHFHNHRTHMNDEENIQNLSFTSYKSKSGKNKKVKKANGQKDVQSNEVCLNIDIVNVNQVSNMQPIVKENCDEHVVLVNGYVTLNQDILIEDDLDCKTLICESVQPANAENDDHKQNESEENEPSICSVIEVNSHVNENNMDFFVDSMNHFENERRVSLVCDDPSGSSNNIIPENNSEEQDQERENQNIYLESNAILTDGKQGDEHFSNEETINNLKKDQSFVSDDYYFDEKIQEMEEYLFDLPKSQFVDQFKVFFNKDMENNSTLDKNKTDSILLNEEESENIHCTDENLEAEVLTVIEYKSEIFPKPTIKKSMTLGSRDHPNSDRQSATTITNVTSISDEHINLNYDSDCKPSKSSKKRNKFVKTVLNKLRKKKGNTKIEKNEEIKSSTEDRLVENNEYFDDASIDCNSHAKGYEIDSNKALKSYDESINNYGDPKQNDDHNQCENNFSDDEENKLENVEGLPQPNIEKVGDEFQNDKLSIKIRDLDQSSTEKESPSSRSMNCDKPEKVKKKKIFNLFSKIGNNNNKSNNNSKNVSKPKDDSKVIDIPKSTDICNEKVEISTNHQLSQALNNQDTLKIETNLSEDLLNDPEMSPSPGEPLKSDIETLDQSFKFLNNFESSPVKDIKTSGTEKSSDHEKCLENNNDIDFYLCANIENNTTYDEIPKKKKKFKDKNDHLPISKNEDITNDNLKNKITKDKQKKKFWTLFSKSKKKQDTGKERRKSWTYENPDDDDAVITKENVLENEQPKQEDQHFSDFNDVYNSLNPKIITKNETVTCKNKNDFPGNEIEDDLTNKDIVYINDDHLFPDSLTPSKITHLEPGEPYSFAFIDDPVIVEQDKYTMFKGENKKVLMFSEFYAPFASSETLFTSEDSDDIEMCEKSKSPIRTLKRPLSSLLGLLSRYR